MAEAWIELRRRIVKAYQAGISGTYEATAKMFGVGEATVSRALRRFRETGDVQYKPKGGNNPRKVDVVWLAANLEHHPDARLVDRIEAWRVHAGDTVSVGAMWNAVRECGWTHKKKSSGPGKRQARGRGQAGDLRR
jgi:transposase